MKNILFLLTFASVAVFAIGLALSGEPASDKPKKAENNKETISLGYICDKYEQVKFEHWKHQDVYKFDNASIPCLKCHHESAKADGSDAAKCSSCHQKDETEKDGKKIPKLESAFHGKCRDCHKEAAKAGNEKVPTKCTGCHAKKKSE